MPSISKNPCFKKSVSENLTFSSLSLRGTKKKKGKKFIPRLRVNPHKSVSENLTFSSLSLRGAKKKEKEFHPSPPGYPPRLSCSSAANSLLGYVCYEFASTRPRGRR